MFLKKKRVSFLWLLRQKEKEGYLVSESIALINQNKGSVNTKFNKPFNRILSTEV
jgi:hypothetical protein